MKSRTLTTVAVAVMAVVAGLFVSAAPAAAATVQPAATVLGNFSVSYSKSWTFKSQPLGICLVMTASGTMSYTLEAQGEPRGGIYEWVNQKVNAPKLAAVVHAYSGGSCSGPATTTKVTMAQHWAGWSCNFNPSVTVSAPWGVSLSAWPSCSSRDQAAYSTTYATTSTGYTQNNTGSPVSYGTAQNASKTAYPCYGV